jgi:iron(III) transport system substrate-binding protein
MLRHPLEQLWGMHDKKTQMKWHSSFYFNSFLALLLWIPGMSYGASFEEIVSSLEKLPREQRLQKQIEGAKHERKLLFYTSTAAEESQERSNAFKKKYPFVTDVEVYRATSERLTTRLTVEDQSKKHFAGVVIMNGADVYLAKKNGLLGRYMPADAKALPRGFIDPEGYWTALNVIPYVLEYNTRLVNPQHVPKRLTDLLDPSWKGKKLALDDREYFWFANMLKALGEKPGLDFMRRLEAQDLNIRKGHNLMNQLVVAGEYPANLVQYSHVTQRSIKAGAPVDWVGIDPIITGAQSIALLKNPPHPYTAMLFADFLLSEEGQTMLRNRGFIPSRENIEPDPPRLKKGLKLVPGDPAVMDDIQKYGSQFQQIFKIN